MWMLASLVLDVFAEPAYSIAAEASADIPILAGVVEPLAF
jgi:hypothetical protein